MPLQVCAKKCGQRSKVPNADKTQGGAELPLEMRDLDAAFDVLRPLDRLVLAVSGGAILLL